jgi:hypothetical protein
LPLRCDSMFACLACDNANRHRTIILCGCSPGLAGSTHLQLGLCGPSKLARSCDAMERHWIFVLCALRSVYKISDAVNV